MVDLCSDYALKNDLIFNSQKSFDVAILPPKFQLFGVPTLTFYHNQIIFVDSVRYLGIYLSSTLNEMLTSRDKHVT